MTKLEKLVREKDDVFKRTLPIPLLKFEINPYTGKTFVFIDGSEVLYLDALKELQSWLNDVLQEVEEE